MKSLINQRNPEKKYFLLCLFIWVSISVCSQSSSTITGIILEEKNNEPVPFVSVGLMETSGNALQLHTGTISDDNGVFLIQQIPNGKYVLKVTSVGHKRVALNLEISTSEMNDVGTIYLRDSSYCIAEAVVVADRIMAKSETDKTAYFINDKMLSATGNAPDLLRQIPGVQVDLKQNISIEGQSNILLNVDGIERDKSYVSQLAPSQIEKIEVFNTPPSNYDGNVSGVINIVLKKEKESGLSGHVFSEIPFSTDVVYMFPAYSFNYNYNKINLYTSYNGEINYEDIDEKTTRQIIDNTSVTDITSVQQVRQKNLSHKFHYGIDYHLTSKDVINFYGFYNAYSYEQDGDVVVQATGIIDWEAQKEETDNNRNLFNSLYYKHTFNTEGRELTVDISNAHIRSENKVVYQNNSMNQINTEKPKQTSAILKADFTTPLNEKMKWSTGIKIKTRDMHDDTSDGFFYDEQVYALYGALNYKQPNFDVNAGLRAEKAETKLYKNQDNSSFSLLPYVAFHYRIGGNSDLYLNYRRSVNRPTVYQLNPYSYTDNPFTISRGNPLLRSVFHNRVQLEYSTRFKSNFITTQLFYETKSNAINNLTYLNDSNLFVTQAQNLGDFHQYGLQLTAALKFGMLSANLSFRLYNQSTFGNNTAKQHGIENNDNLVFESGVSAILSFKKDFALSLIFQYASAKENIQDNAYSDALYFISVDKTFRKNLKIGLVSALPFSKTFVYQGSDMNAANFTSESTGNLKLPTIPLMFRVSYQFNVGKKRNIFSREKEHIETRPKQGF